MKLRFNLFLFHPALSPPASLCTLILSAQPFRNVSFVITNLIGQAEIVGLLWAEAGAPFKNLQKGMLLHNESQKATHCGRHGSGVVRPPCNPQVGALILTSVNMSLGH